MHRFVSLVMLGFSVLAGCQSLESDRPARSRYEKLSAEIERLETESLTAAATGENIRIVVDMLTTYLEDYQDIDVLWRYVNRDVAIIEYPQVFERSGLKVGLAGDAFKVKLNIAKGRIETAEEIRSFITVCDGCTGHITVGKEIAVLGFSYFGQWYNNIDYNFRRAERSLKVNAQRTGTGRIVVEVTPTFSKFLSDAGDMEMTRLTTRVIARPGQMVVLGGTSRAEREDLSTAFLSSLKGARETRTIITLTPYLQ